MREYTTRCPKTDCLGIITIEMEDSDPRRNNGDFFEITCQHCKQKSYAKIFETLVTYPHKIFKEDK